MHGTPWVTPRYTANPVRDVSGRGQGERLETNGHEASSALCVPSPIQVDGHALTTKQRASWKKVLAVVAVRANSSNMEDVRLRLLKIAAGDLSKHRYRLS